MKIDIYFRDKYIGSGTGSGLTARTLGASSGTETMLNHSHSSGTLFAKLAPDGNGFPSNNTGSEARYVTVPSWQALPARSSLPRGRP